MNKEEKELLKSFEKGEWKKAANYKSLLNDSKIAAKEFLKKDTRINIRLNSLDLDLIKKIAVREGLPYQSLISSIIHKFVNNY